MMEQKNIKINQLPTRTWNRLGVNDAEILWGEPVPSEAEIFTVKAGECPEPLHVTADDGGEAYRQKNLTLTVEENSTVTVFEVCTAEKPLQVRLSVELRKNAKVRLVQFLHPTAAILRHEMRVNCAENSRFELISVLLGQGDIYTDDHVVLTGNESSVSVDYGYLGRESRTVDVNLAVDHFGKKTNSDIHANGALADAAKKVFRGTIDFKKGSSDSVGSENETVLMLGDEVVNKTVPIILCAEENVDGSHGATIGDLDEATLFYFASRGIGREKAQAMMARAAIERLARMAENAAFEEQIMQALSEDLGDGE